MIKRFLNKNKHIIKCSREVLEAIGKKIPLVALESSIVSHGMPYPQSFEMAKEIEKIIKDEGAQPATLAVLDGKIQIGLDPEVLDAFAKMRSVEKVSSSNLDSTIFSKKPGGTTVSGTLKAVEFQLSKDVDFSYIDFQSTTNNVGLEQTTTGTLAGFTTYYARVRHVSNSDGTAFTQYYSNYSAGIVSFATLGNAPGVQTPFITGPVNALSLIHI